MKEETKKDQSLALKAMGSDDSDMNLVSPRKFLRRLERASRRGVPANHITMT